MPKLSPPTGDRGKLVKIQRTWLFEDQITAAKSLVCEGRFKNTAELYRFALDLVIYGKIVQQKEVGVPIDVIEKAMDDFRKRMKLK